MESYFGFNQSEFDRWLSDSGDSTHRLNYDLNENSFVFDLGGFRGDWSENIAQKYNSNIYIFEPVFEFFDKISERFKNNSKVKVFNFGLGPIDESLDISVSTDESSIFNTEGIKEKIQLKNVISFLETNNIQNVDLIKINIEGGEYDLIESLIKNNKIKLFKNIQVQFHRFIPNCFERRKLIREELEKTHTLTYDYEFLWENWQLK